MVKSQLDLFSTPAPIKFETLDTPWRELSFLCVDTETTGLSDKNDRVIELAWVLFNKTEEAEQSSRLCKVSVPLPAKIIELTGITDQMLQGEQPFETHVDDFLAALTKASFIVAYNAPFDRGFIEAELKRLGRTLPELPWIDPCVYIREFDRYQKSKRLIDAAARWGVPLNNAHRALHDAKATAYLLHKISPKLKANTLRELVSLQNTWQAEQDRSYKAYTASKMQPNR